jgi:hypothetical protein
MRRLAGLVALVVLVTAGGVRSAPEKHAPREMLRAFQDLIGSWRCTGEPYGTREEKLKGFWQEKMAWQWQFKGEDAWLALTIDKGKYFRSAEVRYLPETDVYQIKAVTLDKETLTFEGKLDKRKLSVERRDPKSKQDQRLVFSLLHANRYLIRYEIRPADHTAFTPLYQIGCTKEGVAFASGDDKPECIVSGGRGTMPVVYNGKTYYVCCTGCRDAFKEDPEKYIKEAEEARKKKE